MSYNLSIFFALPDWPECVTFITLQWHLNKYFQGEMLLSCNHWSHNFTWWPFYALQAILWDFRQNVALTKCCGHEAPISDVKFYPLVGKKRYPLLLSSGDYSVRMWHPLASSKELLKLKQHNFGAEVSMKIHLLIFIFYLEMCQTAFWCWLSFYLLFAPKIYL